jgi:hypothetical protein
MVQTRGDNKKKTVGRIKIQKYKRDKVKSQ